MSGSTDAAGAVPAGAAGARPPAPRHGQPRLDEVAALSGLSRATVSRVVNGSPKVSPHARSAVDRAIAELGYVPNLAARSLVTRRTDTVAVLVSESQTRIFWDPFFATAVRCLATALAELDLQMILLLGSSTLEHDRAARFVRQGHVDGVILLSLHAPDPLPQQLWDGGVPTVMWGGPTGRSRVPSVDADNRGGGMLATRHLLRIGCQSVATVTGPQDMRSGVARLQGYRAALRAARVPAARDLIEPGDFTEDGGARAMAALLHRCPGLDGVFVASDLMAAGALAALHAAGRRVPEDVAVVGFDDLPSASDMVPPLTTVRQPLEDMSRLTCDLLTQQIAGSGGTAQVIAPTTLVRRASA